MPDNRYVSIAALEHALDRLMARRNLKSWITTAFDAADIDALIHEPPVRILDCEGMTVPIVPTTEEEGD